MNKDKSIQQLEKLIDELQDNLFSFAFFRLGDEKEAEDMVQETFIRYYRESQKTHIVNDKAWLYKVLHRLCINHQRSPMKTVSLKAIENREDDTHQELFREYIRIEQLLAPLPEEQATIVKMHFTDELTFSEIADILGISRDTVKSRYRYAMDKLQKTMKKKTNFD